MAKKIPDGSINTNPKHSRNTRLGKQETTDALFTEHSRSKRTTDYEIHIDRRGQVGSSCFDEGGHYDQPD